MFTKSDKIARWVSQQYLPTTDIKLRSQAKSSILSALNAKTTTQYILHIGLRYFLKFKTPAPGNVCKDD